MLDPTLSGGGFVTQSVGSSVSGTSVVIDAVGSSHVTTTGSTGMLGARTAHAHKYLEDGAHDLTLGDAGVLDLSVLVGGTYVTAASIALDADGNSGQSPELPP